MKRRTDADRWHHRLRAGTLGLFASCCLLATALAQTPSLAPSAAPTPELVPSPAASGLKFSGFGTLGYWESSGPRDLTFRRELSQNTDRIDRHPARADSRLGLQINYALNSRTEAVAQLVVREKADSQFKDSVEWAFAKYRPTQNTEIRLGRTGFAAFMLSDYRNVGYAYNWVRPPQEFYGWIPFYSVDGGDAVYESAVGEGQLRTKLFVGQTETGLPIGPNSYRMRAAIWGAGLEWSNDEWRLRATHTHLRFKKQAPFAQVMPYLDAIKDYWPTAAQYLDDLNLIGQRLNYNVVGATWDRDGWQLAAEIALTNTTTTFMPQGASTYVFVGKRFDQWVPFYTFSRIWDLTQLNLDAPPSLPGYEAVVAGVDAGLRAAYEQTHSDQYTNSIGVRWDFTHRAALKLQWDRTVVSPDGTQMWGFGDVPFTGKAKQVWSATLDFLF